MIMIEQKKIYLGSIKTEQEAARYYDIITIISMGMTAKTNFSYTKAQLQNLFTHFDSIFSLMQSNSQLSDDSNKDEVQTNKKQAKSL